METREGAERQQETREEVREDRIVEIGPDGEVTETALASVPEKRVILHDPHGEYAVDERQRAEELERLFARQTDEVPVEIDQDGNIVEHQPERREGKRVILHDPHGEFGPEAGYRVNEGLVMTPDDLRRDRWFVEQDKLKATLPGFALTATDGRVAAAVGVIETNLGNRYPIRVELPEGYPFEMPRVVPVDWKPKWGCPHLYRGGELCLMRASQWNSKLTLAFVVSKAAIWLNKYEVWRRTKKWPGLGQRH